MYFESFITSINVRIIKLEKYFPRQIPTTLLYKYKPLFIGIILDPRYKLFHFQLNGLLDLNSTISNNVTKLLIDEYLA